MSLIPFSYSNSIGKTPGVSRAFISGFCKDVQIANLPQTIWPGVGLMPVFTVAQSLEVVSTDPNDTFGGTGLNIVRIGLRDFNFASVTLNLNMNGLTPVPLPGGPYIGTRILNTVASPTGVNQGDILIRVVGGVVLDIMPAKLGFRKTCAHIVTRDETNDVLYIQAGIYHPTKKDVSAIISTRQVFADGTTRQELQFPISSHSISPVLMGEGAVFISLGSMNQFSLEVADISDNGVEIYASMSLLQWTLQARLSL